MPKTPEILTEAGLLDELTYLNYAHNRRVDRIPAEMFKRYYSEAEVDAMEKRFQAENPVGDMPARGTAEEAAA